MEGLSFENNTIFIYNPSYNLRNGARKRFNNLIAWIFERLVQFDINSSYAWQIMKRALSVGKAYIQTLIRQYGGKSLNKGIYQQLWRVGEGEFPDKNEKLELVRKLLSRMKKGTRIVRIKQEIIQMAKQQKRIRKDIRF